MTFPIKNGKIRKNNPKNRGKKMQEKILVTGGAGFIGTHTVIELIQAGHQVVVVDNLVNSNRKSLEVVERITGVEVPFYEADIRDTDTLRDIFKQEEPTGVITLLV